jgi:ElaB/YqjD/DUF883 family membrane-anchored ribosome-binding protein
LSIRDCLYFYQSSQKQTGSATGSDKHFPATEAGEPRQSPPHRVLSSTASLLRRGAEPFRADSVGNVGGMRCPWQTGAVAMDGQQMADTAAEVAEGANAKLKETIDRAGEAVSAAGETAKAVADRARSAGVEAGTRIRQAVQEAGNQGGQVLRDMSQRGSDVGRYVSDTTAAHPLAALLIAAAVGYGLARMTIR